MFMGTPNFTEKAKRVLASAKREAMEFGHDYISTEHLILAMTQVSDSMAVMILTNLGVDITELRAEIEKGAFKGSYEENLRPGASPFRIGKKSYKQCYRGVKKAWAG